jgi:RNA-directed DNA polymerase
MVSLDIKQRKQKISQETCPQREAVNTPGYEEGPSLTPAQTKESIREVHHNHLMEQVLEKANLKRAYNRVKQNKGAPGMDGVTVEDLQQYLWDNWGRIKMELLNGIYKPQPVRRVEIPKADGGVRLLGIPTVIDRLIQQAVSQVLTPIFDPIFSPFSYGFRPGRGAHMAVKQAQQYIKQGYRHVVDMDLEKFFDKVNHDILMSKVAKKIGDKRILRLIRRYLQSGAMINGCCVRTEEGTPQGGPLSPLLANIMLHELDEELMKREHRFVRYADDCNVYVKSKRAGIRVLESVKKLVEKRLKLKVNQEKSAADRPWKRKILGFSFTSAKVAAIRLADKTRERFKNKIREITRRARGQSLAERIEKLNTYLKGWVGYFYVA